MSPSSSVLWVRNEKTIYRKLWPANLLRVSNLTFDPSFKVKWGHLTKMAIYLICCSLGLEPCAKVNIPFLLNSQWEITIVALVLLYVYLCQ